MCSKAYGCRQGLEDFHHLFPAILTQSRVFGYIACLMQMQKHQENISRFKHRGFSFLPDSMYPGVFMAKKCFKRLPVVG